MIRNVIFDFGGVLFEWKPYEIVTSFTDSSDEQRLLIEGVLHHPDWLCLDRGTMLMAEVIPKFAARTGLSESRMEDFFEHILNSLVKINETENLLFQVIDHHYSVYYLTNMSSAFFETLNDRHSLISLFKGGLVSGKELMMKPEPDIFQLLIERYDLVPSESLYIDDHEQNLIAAQAFGFHTVLFEQSASCFNKIQNILSIS